MWAEADETRAKAMRRDLVKDIFARFLLVMILPEDVCGDFVPDEIWRM